MTTAVYLVAYIRSCHKAHVTLEYENPVVASKDMMDGLRLAKAVVGHWYNVAPPQDLVLLRHVQRPEGWTLTCAS